MTTRHSLAQATDRHTQLAITLFGWQNTRTGNVVSPRLTTHACDQSALYGQEPRPGAAWRNPIGPFWTHQLQG